MSSLLYSKLHADLKIKKNQASTNSKPNYSNAVFDSCIRIINLCTSFDSLVTFGSFMMIPSVVLV